MLTALTLLTTPSAEAGELTITKRGLMPAIVWIDGVSKGKVKKKRPVRASVSRGTHEVWVAIEAGGTVTRCHGLVDVPASGATVAISDMGGCTNLKQGFGPTDATAFRGSSIDFSTPGIDAWVRVDGSQPMALPDLPFLLNLTPGSHSIVLLNDLMDESVFDQGTVTLREGEHINVTCTTSGCSGFDMPPAPIEYWVVEVPVPVPSPAPASDGIQVNVQLGGIQVDMSVGSDTLNLQSDLGDFGTNVSMQGSTTTPVPSSNTSSSNSCCVNRAYYACPTADAVYQCSGKLMSCMTSCALDDMDCPSQCMDAYPPDPGACTRTPSLDSTCSN